MVITDRLSKAPIFEAMHEITAEATAKRLLWCLIRYHGLPSAIVSDRGTQFVNRMWKRVCELLKIVHRLSTAFHPETDGSTERMNQTLESYLRAYTAYFQNDWYDLLPAAIIALSGRPAASTGMSPFFITHGYDLSPIQLQEGEHLRTEGVSMRAKGEALVARWKMATEAAQAAMAMAQEEQERQANAQRRAADQFQIGDKVWLRLKNITTERPSKKLDWVNAEYEVIEVIGTHAVKLNTPPGIHPVFHVSLVRRTAADPFPSQVQDDIEPPAITEEGSEEWRVEEILEVKKQRRRFRAKVKWVGYVNPTWEPLEELLETTALDRYEERHGPINAVRSPNGRLIEGGDNVTGCPVEISSSSPRGMETLQTEHVPTRTSIPKARVRLADGTESSR